MILSGDTNIIRPPIRRAIYKHIAVIYESMLNVSEEKKAIISKKIMEVNELCSQSARVCR